MHAGALVQMVTMTVSDMRWFVLLLFVVMFGFGTSFLVLFSGMQQQSPDFADVDDALLSMFLFMLGSFNMETFDSAAVPSAAVLLFVFYEVCARICHGWLNHCMALCTFRTATISLHSLGCLNLLEA